MIECWLTSALSHRGGVQLLVGTSDGYVHWWDWLPGGAVWTLSATLLCVSTLVWRCCMSCRLTVVAQCAHLASVCYAHECAALVYLEVVGEQPRRCPPTLHLC